MKIKRTEFVIRGERAWEHTAIDIVDAWTLKREAHFLVGYINKFEWSEYIYDLYGEGRLLGETE